MSLLEKAREKAKKQKQLEIEEANRKKRQEMEEKAKEEEERQNLLKKKQRDIEFFRSLFDKPSRYIDLKENKPTEYERLLKLYSRQKDLPEENKHQNLYSKHIWPYLTAIAEEKRRKEQAEANRRNQELRDKQAAFLATRRDNHDVLKQLLCQTSIESLDKDSLVFILDEQKFYQKSILQIAKLKSISKYDLNTSSCEI